MPLYLVIGRWPDTAQRFADDVIAPTADAAEEATLEEHPGLDIAATLRMYEPSDHDLPDYVKAATKELVANPDYAKPCTPRVMEIAK